MEIEQPIKLEFVSLEDHPLAAAMVGKGDKIFYFDEKEKTFLEAKVSDTTKLKFGKEPTYEITFTNKSKHHESGEDLKVERSLLCLEKRTAERKAESFLLMEN